MTGGEVGATALLRLPVADRKDATKPTKPLGVSKYISMRQATNIIDAVHFAKFIGVPLIAHLTIHWGLTDVGDDPDGTLFAKLREGLDKWLQRRGIAFNGAWSRERQSGGVSDVVHCHLLFHLPVAYRAGARLRAVEAAITRLVTRHGNDYWADQVIKLVIHDEPPYPDGKYLIKGGGPKIWKKFGLRKEHRRLQGLISGKRCGTTQKLGPAARRGAAGRPETSLVENVGEGQIRSSRGEMWETG